MKYCSICAAPLEVRIPDDDDRPRHCCTGCGAVHYLNPKVIVGCIPIWEEKILMCKRGIEPRLGYWTLPGGFMELNETTDEGAARETWEETRAKVDIQHLHGVYNIPHINQVYFFYLAKMRTPDFEITPESTEIKLVTKDEIPWEHLAFGVVEKALRQYLDGKNETVSTPYFHTHMESSKPSPNTPSQ